MEGCRPDPSPRRGESAAAAAVAVPLAGESGVRAGAAQLEVLVTASVEAVVLTVASRRPLHEKACPAASCEVEKPPEATCL